VFTLRIQNVSGQPTQKNLSYGPIASGRTYVVQSVTGLVAGAWSSQATSAPQTNGTQVTVTDQSVTNSAKFYRIDIQYVPPVDSVGDGIPDCWRVKYFGGSGTNTNSVSCAACDPDGDGMNNLQEYLTGTDPTNGASCCCITSVVRTNNNLLVSWMTGNGRTNVLQVSTGTAGSYASNFTDIFTVTNTVSTVTNYLDIGGATNTPSRYYHVRLVP
jgi:hypothetical protein